MSFSRRFRVSFPSSPAPPYRLPSSCCLRYISFICSLTVIDWRKNHIVSYSIISMAIVAVSSFISLLFVALFSIYLVAGENRGFGGAVFSVNSKLHGNERSLSVLKAHDKLRFSHLRILAVDIPLGGIGRIDAVGLYYAKIGIGTPPREYYVQVDTGCDIMWINCIDCQDCPKKGYNGLDLTRYDLELSLTGKAMTCDEKFCREINGGTVTGCKANTSCMYTQLYGDGSESFGSFVKDAIQYDSVSGDLETKLATGSVVFGCGANLSGTLASSEEAFDGILGFGKSNTSVVSQLASSGKVKRMFAHCLDGDNGGGIFAIGHVVQPKVNSTHLIQDEPHYAVNVIGIEVGTKFLNLSKDTHGRGEKQKAIIDSGTTLAYLPEVIYKPLMNKIVEGRSDMISIPHDQYTCFKFSESADYRFPAVTFHFENSLSLKVYSHDYIFSLEDFFCFGWQNNGVDSISSSDMIVLGDMVLSDKLVVYDLENQTIGWTKYNCSSSIMLRDEATGLVRLVGAHSITSACSRIIYNPMIFLLLIALLNLMLP